MNLRPPCYCCCLEDNQMDAISPEVSNQDESATILSPFPRPITPFNVENYQPWWYNSLSTLQQEMPPITAEPSPPPALVNTPIESVIRNYRVDTSTNPWLEGEAHCPGLVARYTINIDTSSSRQIVNLHIQTWSNIYRMYKFYKNNLKHTELEIKNGDNVIKFNMNYGKPIILSFECDDDIYRAHNYFFEQLGC